MQKEMQDYRLNQNIPVTASSPTSSRTDSLHSPISSHYPPTSSAAAQEPSLPSARTSVHVRQPPPPSADTAGCECHIRKTQSAAPGAAHTSNSNTRQSQLLLRGAAAETGGTRIPAERRGVHWDLAGAVQRTLCPGLGCLARFDLGLCGKIAGTRGALQSFGLVVEGGRSLYGLGWRLGAVRCSPLEH